MRIALEAGTVAGVAFTGLLFLVAAGFRDSWSAATLSLPLGASIVSGVGAVLLFLRLPTYPFASLALSALVVGGFAAASLRRAKPSRGQPMRWLLVVVGYFLASALIHEAAFVSVTPDTYRYLSTAGIVGRTGEVELTNAFLLETRGWTFPFLHAFGVQLGSRYLVSLGPLVAACGLALLVWFAKNLRPLARRDFVGVVGVVAFVAVTERYAYHAVYVNGHMLFAVLAGVVSSGLVLSRHASNEGMARPLALSLAAVPALALLRPEAPLIVALLLVPFVATEAPRRFKAAIVASLGVPTLAWSVLVAVMYGREAREIPFSTIGLLAFGALTCLLAVVLLKFGQRVPSRTPRALFVLIVFVTSILAVIESEVFVKSLQATARNTIVEGLWGLSLVLLAGLLVAAYVMVARFPGRRTFGFPLAAFVPVAFILAHLRGGAYRVGTGDSLNRMFLHLFLVGALALTASYLSAGHAGLAPRPSGPRGTPR